MTLGKEKVARMNGKRDVDIGNEDDYEQEVNRQWEAEPAL